MSMVAHTAAPANAIPLEPFPEWDRTPDLSAIEYATLQILGTRFSTHQRQWPATIEFRRIGR